MCIDMGSSTRTWSHSLECGLIHWSVELFTRPWYHPFCHGIIHWGLEWSTRAWGYPIWHSVYLTGFLSSSSSRGLHIFLTGQIWPKASFCKPMFSMKTHCHGLFSCQLSFFISPRLAKLRDPNQGWKTQKF